MEIINIVINLLLLITTIVNVCVTFFRDFSKK